MALLMTLSEVLSQLDFLLLDEPTIQLDENRRKELVNVLENLKTRTPTNNCRPPPRTLSGSRHMVQVTLNNEGKSGCANERVEKLLAILMRLVRFPDGTE